jgi:hypothetical protein
VTITAPTRAITTYRSMRCLTCPRPLERSQLESSSAEWYGPARRRSALRA